MARIKFLLQSKSSSAPIYLRLSLSQNTSVKRKTGLFINPGEWSKSTGLPKQNNSIGNKDLMTELRELETFIYRCLNEINSDGGEITGDWLSNHIDLHFKRTIKGEDNSLIGHIQRIIDTASTKRLANGKIGLSKNRIKGYVTFKGVMEAFQIQIKKTIQFKDITPAFEENFRNWLLMTKKYSTNYAGKNFDNLKAVCRDAERMGIEVHSHATNILSFSESKDERRIITLSFDELDQIGNLEGLSESMENIRKWLLLGCELGQRAGDLLRITKENFKTRDGIEFIDIKQEKTGKEVSVAVRPVMRKIVETGMPYEISIQKFNKYLKDLCRIAELDTPTKGKLHDKIKGRKVTKDYPKYKLISSHVCRRSFATNYYKLIPTPVLMSTTGHSKESLFLAYIGEKEDRDSDAKLMLKYGLIVEEERRKELERRRSEQKVKMETIHKNSSM